ncbi:MAG: hypothetical protein WC459_04040 [Patescibacteria group bacterium]
MIEAGLYILLFVVLIVAFLFGTVKLSDYLRKKYGDDKDDDNSHWNIPPHSDF